MKKLGDYDRWAKMPMLRAGDRKSRFGCGLFMHRLRRQYFQGNNFKRAYLQLTIKTSKRWMCRWTKTIWKKKTI